MAAVIFVMREQEEDVDELVIVVDGGDEAVMILDVEECDGPSAGYLDLIGGGSCSRIDVRSFNVKNSAFNVRRCLAFNVQRCLAFNVLLRLSWNPKSTRLDDTQPWHPLELNRIESDDGVIVVECGGRDQEVVGTNHLS